MRTPETCVAGPDLIRELRAQAPHSKAELDMMVDRGTDVLDLRLFGRHCKCRRAQIVSCQPKDGRALVAGGTGDRRMAIGYGRVKM
jgi:hypothetical protein